ncbi:MAG: hypothetical protein CMH60_07375 [Myxococcales bacterium]|nr:hypothetical protein [Myxococcales bacterium]|tara:strand:- start:693 stop:1196 length:504 start_codon:yes stop_codon:yes gene_type:complete
MQTSAIPTTTVRDFAAKKQRSVSVTDKKGDVYGANFHIPKGDFARFLGFKQQTPDEKAGKMSGARALEVAIEKEFQGLGKQAMQRGADYRNMYVSYGRYANMPGREKDMIKDGIDAINQSVEIGQSTNMRYLEMQYKFQMAGMSYGTLSNLMKARHESVKKSINEIR